MKIRKAFIGIHSRAQFCGKRSKRSVLFFLSCANKILCFFLGFYQIPHHNSYVFNFYRISKTCHLNLCIFSIHEFFLSCVPPISCSKGASFGFGLSFFSHMFSGIESYKQISTKFRGWHEISQPSEVVEDLREHTFVPLVWSSFSRLGWQVVKWIPGTNTCTLKSSIL
jgi:hypothetical protein